MALKDIILINNMEYPLGKGIFMAALFVDPTTFVLHLNIYFKLQNLSL